MWAETFEYPTIILQKTFAKICPESQIIHFESNRKQTLDVERKNLDYFIQSWFVFLTDSDIEVVSSLLNWKQEKIKYDDII